MEQSAISKTASEAEKIDTFSKLESGTASPVDVLFPFIDSCNQKIQVPQIISGIFLLFGILQIFATSFWYQQNKFLVEGSIESNLYKTVISILYWGTGTSSFLAKFIVFTVLFAICAFFITFQVYHHRVHHSLVEWTLYPTRFITEVLPIVILHPIYYQIGEELINMISDGADPTEIVFLILSIIYAIFFTGIYLYTGLLNASSAYLQSGILACYDFEPLGLLIIINPIFLCLVEVMTLYPGWFSLPVIAIHMLILIYLVWRLRLHSFVSSVVNIIIQSSCVVSAVEDFMCLISLAFKNNPVSWWMTGSFALYFSIGVIVCSFVQIRKIKNLKWQLAYNGEINAVDALKMHDPSQFEDVVLDDDQKKERFVSIKLDTDQGMMITYLRIGLANICDMITDLSLMRFALECYTSTEVLAAVTRIVAFIPPETRLLNRTMSVLMRKRDLTMSNRFLIYQLSHIKIIRQSSSSSASASERLGMMKQQTRMCEGTVCGFWAKSDPSVMVLNDAYNSIKKTEALWKESIERFPNSSSIYDQYTWFLVECATDFVGAVMQHHKADQLENGKMFSIDYCFRSLVRKFPRYLKANVFDVKGNYISRGMKKSIADGTNISHGSGSNSSRSHYSSNDSSILDVSVEAEISKSIIKKPKVRLAFQRSVEGRKGNNAANMMIFTVFGSVLSVGIIIVLLIILLDSFSGRVDALRRIRTVTDSRYYASEGVIMTLANWAVNMPDKRFDKDASITGYSNLYSFNISDTFDNIAMHSSTLLRSTLTSFLNDLTLLASQGEKAITTGGPLMKSESPATFCKDGIPLTAMNVSMRTLIVFESISVGLLNGNTDFANWFLTNDEFCGVMSSIDTISSNYDDLINNLLSESVKTALEFKDTMRICQIVIPIVYVIVTIVNFVIVSLKYRGELSHLGKLMQKMDNKDKKEAIEPISRNLVSVSTSSGDHESDNTEPVLYMVAIIFIFLLLACVAIVSFEETIYTNTQFIYLAQWNTLSNMRTGMSLEAVFSAFVAVWTWPGTTYSMSSNAIDPEHFATNSQELIKKIRQNSVELETGSSLAPGWGGQNSELDRINNMETCIPNASDTSIHESYNCGSAKQVERFFFDMTDNIIYQVEKYDGLGTHEDLSQLFHIEFAHLVSVYDRIADVLDGMINSISSKFTLMLVITCVVGMVLAFIQLGLLFRFLFFLNNMYTGAMTILRRVSPHAVIANTDLINYLLNREKSKQNDDSTSASVIRNSSDCIVTVSVTGIIESINLALTGTLGYTPEQLLGQNISVIFDTANSEEVLNRMHLMSEKQASNIYENSVTCKNDTDDYIHCKMTMLGMQTDSKEIKAFVVILRDEEDLIRQQEIAEKAKKRSEELLYQILPRDIVTKLNQGEKDVTFTVDCASVMFIDVVKFSDYSAGMPPQEIMGNLSQLFHAFDDAAANYPSIIKIKLIGDVYMCAAGLFSPPDTPAVVHTEELLRFGLDCLLAVEELNIRLSSSLQVRIGMNTGGPILAGILGTDKPVFDIIGDTINVAARLQSTDVASKIQISQASFDIVKDLDFDIEPRGEVFLKGKGKQNAYLVQPAILNTLLSFSMTSTNLHRDDTLRKTAHRLNDIQ